MNRKGTVPVPTATLSILSLKALRAVVIAIGLLILSLATPIHAQTNLVTPEQYLQSLPKPQFAPGNNLPHLSRASWPFSFSCNVELATNWGYCLDLGWASTDTVAQISVSNSTVAKYVTLAKAFPDKFAVGVGVWRVSESFTNPPAGLYCTNSGGLFVDQTGTNFFTGNQFTKVISPEGPDDYWASVSDYQASCIRAINSVVPIKNILNAGEYGLSVVGFGAKAWQQDPRVQQQDVMTNRYDYQTNTTGVPFPLYVSRQKSHQLWFLTSKINDYVPKREMYAFYGTGCEQFRFVNPGMGNWETNWANWGWWSEYMNSNTDVPSLEDYYKGPNSWTNATGTTMFNVTDLLTLHLNGIGYDFRLGKTNSYNWVCGGWSNNNTNLLSSIPRYMGFLKCLYTAGMVGGAAGYFAYPAVGTNNNGWIFGTNGFLYTTFPIDQPPHWLQQVVALSRVHAEFSYLTNWLYGSQLISGPQRHFKSSDQPAYEFTNNAADPNIRVLARKMYNTNEWLICAWAADGANRNATVTIPILGTVQVLARDCGSIYTGTITNLTLVDKNGLFPTGRILLAPPSDLRVTGRSG
jgi:hypothetical protein